MPTTCGATVAAAGRAYTEAIAISQSIGHFIIHIMATLGLAHVQELDNQLGRAAETYRQVLRLVGDPPLPVACGAHLGLARIFYEWNDLAAAHTACAARRPPGTPAARYRPSRGM